MHICISKLTIIGSDNVLLHVRRQAFIWTNAGVLLIGPLGINFSEILTVWHKTKFGSQKLATKFGNHLCMATKIGNQS